VNNQQLKGLQTKPFFYRYLITDPDYYGSDTEVFQNKLTKVLQTHRLDILCFRDKITQDINSLAKTCLEIAKEQGVPKILINGNIDLAVTLGFDGVHLTSAQFEQIERAKEKNLFTIISCHSEQEVQSALQKGADGVSYSPIFFKEKKDTPKGCENLKILVDRYQKKDFLIMALGGITDDIKLKEVQGTGCSGFASIGYFADKL
jgi:thiamine-phosphate pyrophosphorylase